MLDRAFALLITLVALGGFAVVAVLAARGAGARDHDHFITARGTQATRPLALSFFASALGTWILVAPPEVGTFAGLLGIAGYAVGQASAVALFAVLGPAVAARLPRGSTILEFVRLRFGRVLHVYVGAVSALYMFVFLIAELTAIGLVLPLVAPVPPLVPVVAVAAATAGYTAYGGLPASLATDRWQAWLILALAAGGAVAVALEVGDPGATAVAGGALAVHATGAETFAVLAIAVVAANLFHQGFWQRVWAARDRDTAVRGALGGAVLIVPVVLAAGVAGAIAAGAGRVEIPSLAFFALLQGLPAPALALVVALAVALVASTVDTLQNALTSLVTVDLAGGRLSLGAARLVTVALTAAAAAVAVQGLSVLRLFLVADLLAATIALPVFLGLWRRVTPAAALVGSVAGLLGVVAVGWVLEGSLIEGARLLTLPEGLSLAAFVAAPVASAVVTLAVAAATGGISRPTRAPPEAAR